MVVRVVEQRWYRFRPKKDAPGLATNRHVGEPLGEHGGHGILKYKEEIRWGTMDRGDRSGELVWSQRRWMKVLGGIQPGMEGDPKLIARRRGILKTHWPRSRNESQKAPKGPEEGATIYSTISYATIS